MANFIVVSNADTGLGTLRDAITLSNNNTDASNLITFALTPGQPITPASALPSITHSNLTIDGQIGANGRVELNGTNVALTSGAGLTISGTATNITLENLAINRFKGNGITLGGSGNSAILGCNIGTDPTGTLVASNTGNGVSVTSPNNTIGARNAAGRNIISGNSQAQISLSGAASQTLIVGNIIGADATGTKSLAPPVNVPDGISVGSAGNSIGGAVVGARNLISGNNYGISFASNSATDNLVRGNYIGTDLTGSVAIPNLQYGIYIAGPPRNTIGGSASGAGNLISGNALAGIFVQGQTTAVTQIFGNQIGTSATTSVTGIPNGSGVGGVGGIQLVNTAGVQIGFAQLSGPVAPGYANTIAFNTGTGITVSGGSSAGILTNSIYSNTGLGIALTNLGNNNVQAPFLNSVDTTPTSTLIIGQFFGTPNTKYRIQFFSNNTLTPSGRDGQTFIGEVDVTSIGGFTTFNTLLPVTVATGLQVTATLTQGPLTLNNTSQFSNSQVARPSIRPDLAVGITTSPTALLTGQPFDFQYAVSNTGQSTATNVVLTVQLPAGVRYSLNGGTTYQTSTASSLTFNLGDLAQGDSTTVSIRVIAPTTFSNITTSAIVSSSVVETNNSNNSATLTKPFAPVADLAVYLTPPTGPIPVGSTFSYVVTLVNSGPNIANDAVVKVTLPASLTNVVVTIDQGTASPVVNNVVTIDSGVVPGAFSVPIMITATATQVGTFAATANVTESTGEADSKPGNNTSTASITVAKSADLGIAISATPNPVLIGGRLIYGVTITNNGPSDATAPVLTDVIPNTLFFNLADSSISQGTLRSDGVQVIGDIGPLAAGASVQAFLSFTPTAGGVVANTVSVANSADVDTVPTNNSATTSVAISPSALGVVIVPPANPLTIGVAATYTILVTNNGPADAPGVVLTDFVPVGATVGNVTVTPGSSSTTVVPPFGTNVVANLGTIASGQTTTVTVTITPTRSLVLTNSASVTTTGYDPNTADNAATSSNQVSPADLAIATSATTTGVLVNEQTATYTITVANNGPALASNVVVTNVLPVNSTLTGLKLSQGGASGTGALAINLGDLASGATATITITVIPTSVGNLVNTATVASSNLDPNAGNNVSQTVVTAFNQPGTFSLAANSVAVNETAGSVSLTINRSGGSLGIVTVRYATADLTAKAGVNYTAASGLLTFADGQMSQTITIPILHDNIIGPNTDFLVSLSNPGGGASLSLRPAAMVTVVNTDRDTVAPLVSSVQPIQTAGGITGFVITFNEPMDATRAQLLSNYAVSLSARDPGKGAGSGVTLSGVTYDDATHSVTLLTSGTLPLNRFFLVNLNGSTGQALTDTSGNILDGDGNGVAGSNFLTTVGQGTRLKYLDGNGNIVTIALSKGGTMTIIRDAAGDATSIALSNIIARQSTLTGSRVRTRNSTSGRVEIGTITGLRRFGDVKSNLTTAPFFATFAPVNVNGSTLSNNAGTTTPVAITKVSTLARKALVSAKVPSGPSF